MPLQTDVRYFKVMGSRKLNTAQVVVYISEVADFTGAALPPEITPMDDFVQVPIAQRPPDDTIVKVTYFSGKTVVINPTS